jgi:hypothetical protein
MKKTDADLKTYAEKKALAYKAYNEALAALDKACQCCSKGS